MKKKKSASSTIALCLLALVALSHSSESNYKLVPQEKCAQQATKRCSLFLSKRGSPSSLSGCWAKQVTNTQTHIALLSIQSSSPLGQMFVSKWFSVPSDISSNSRSGSDKVVVGLCLTLHQQVRLLSGSQMSINSKRECLRKQCKENLQWHLKAHKRDTKQRGRSKKPKMDHSSFETRVHVHDWTPLSEWDQQLRSDSHYQQKG